MTKYRRRKRA